MLCAGSSTDVHPIGEASYLFAETIVPQTRAEGLSFVSGDEQHVLRQDKQEKYFKSP